MVSPLMDLDALHAAGLFDGFSEESLRQVLPHQRDEYFPAGISLFETGGPCLDLYLVRSGELLITVEDRYGVPALVSVLEAGSLAGWSAIFPPRISSASLVTMTDCHLTAFNGEALRRVLSRFPHDEVRLLENVAKVIEDRLHEARASHAELLNHQLRGTPTPPPLL